MKVASLALLIAATLASVASAQVNIHFTNPTSEPAQVEWVNNGSAKYYMTVPPGETRSLQSYVGHQWRFSNSQAVTGRAVTGENQVISLGSAGPRPAPAPAAPVAHEPQALPQFQLPPYQPQTQPQIQPQFQPQPQQTPPSPQQAISNYARSVVGQRVGNGQCTELAVAALRYANAQPNQGYNWGSPLRSIDQLQPGDIVQLFDARFEYPNGTWKASTGPHTAIVSSVDGSTIYVLEQNVGGSPVQEGQYDVRYLTAGRIELFRPVGTSATPTNKIPFGWSQPRQVRANESALQPLRFSLE